MTGRGNGGSGTRPDPAPFNLRKVRLPRTGSSDLARSIPIEVPILEVEPAGGELIVRLTPLTDRDIGAVLDQARLEGSPGGRGEFLQMQAAYRVTGFLEGRAIDFAATGAAVESTM